MYQLRKALARSKSAYPDRRVFPAEKDAQIISDKAIQLVLLFDIAGVCWGRLPCSHQDQI
jgi:hypothetical protein